MGSCCSGLECNFGEEAIQDCSVDGGALYLWVSDLLSSVAVQIAANIKD
jgi:hypothetical protein